MFAVEFATGQRLLFDSAEALARTVATLRSGVPLIVRDERTGQREVLWAPEDED